MKRSILFILSVVLCSCSLQIAKRIYSSGYYVSLKGNHHQTVKPITPHEQKREQEQLVNANDFAKTKNETGATNELVTLTEHQETGGKKKVILQEEQLPVPGPTRLAPAPITSMHENFRSGTVEGGTNDTSLYLLAAFMGLISSLFLLNRSGVLKVTRWANHNKVLAKISIVSLQVLLVFTGVGTGKELARAGLHFSNTGSWVFSGLMGLGFLALFVMERDRSNIQLPSLFLKKKLGHLAIALSLFGVAAVTGNRLETQQHLPVQVNTVQQDLTPGMHSILLNTSYTMNTHAGENVGGLIVLYVLVSIIVILALFLLCCALACGVGAAAAVPAVIVSIILLALMFKSMSKKVEERRAGEKT